MLKMQTTSRCNTFQYIYTFSLTKNRTCIQKTTGVDFIFCSVFEPTNMFLNETALLCFISFHFNNML